MLTTIDLIDLAKTRTAARMGAEKITDYRLAKELKIAPGNIVSWRARRSHISAEFVPRLAEAAALDPAYVFACVESERAKDPAVLQILYRIAEKFTASAALLCLFVLPLIATAPYSCKNSAGIYIMRTGRRRFSFTPGGRHA